MSGVNIASRAEEPDPGQRQAAARVQHNFWVLVAAAVVAVGVLTQALKEPGRPAAAVVVCPRTTSPPERGTT